MDFFWIIFTIVPVLFCVLFGLLMYRLFHIIDHQTTSKAVKTIPATNNPATTAATSTASVLNAVSSYQIATRKEAATSEQLKLYKTLSPKKKRLAQPKVEAHSQLPSKPETVEKCIPETTQTISKEKACLPTKPDNKPEVTEQEQMRHNVESKQRPTELAIRVEPAQRSQSVTCLLTRGQSREDAQSKLNIWRVEVATAQTYNKIFHNVESRIARLTSAVHVFAQLKIKSLIEQKEEKLASVVNQSVRVMRNLVPFRRDRTELKKNNTLLKAELIRVQSVKPPTEKAAEIAEATRVQSVKPPTEKAAEIEAEPEILVQHGESQIFGEEMPASRRPRRTRRQAIKQGLKRFFCCCCSRRRQV